MARADDLVHHEPRRLVPVHRHQHREAKPANVYTTVVEPDLIAGECRDRQEHEYVLDPWFIDVPEITILGEDVTNL